MSSRCLGQGLYSTNGRFGWRVQPIVTALPLRADAATASVPATTLTISFRKWLFAAC